MFLRHFSVTDPPQIQYGRRIWALYRENAKRCNSSSNHDRNEILSVLELSGHFVRTVRGDFWKNKKNMLKKLIFMEKNAFFFRRPPKNFGWNENFKNPSDSPDKILLGSICENYTFLCCIFFQLQHLAVFKVTKNDVWRKRPPKIVLISKVFPIKWMWIKCVFF